MLLSNSPVKNVSERLNEKYKMKENHTWHKTTWKDSPNYHGHAFGMGDVDFQESYESKDVIIINALTYNNGSMYHMVNYSIPDFVKETKAELEAENEF